VTTPLLDVRHLFLQDRATGRTLLHPLSFHINPGERVALVGESGSGKSLTALSIPGLLPSNISIGTQSELIWQGSTLLHTLPERERRRYRGRDIGVIFQDPLHALNPVMTVGAQLIEVLQRHLTLDASQYRKEAINRLSEVELPTPDRLLDVYPCHLSGGQQQRIMIAMAMAARPALLIADEPTTALDPLTQQHLLTLLEHVRTQHHTGLLFISHDLRLVERWADRVLVLEQGYLRENGSTRDIFNSPKHPYTRRLMEACPHRQSVLQHRSFSNTPTPTTPAILALDQITVRVDSGHTSNGRAAFRLAPISLNIREGHSIGLIGGSGSGKTTLARLIMGLLPSQSGILSYRGTPVRQLTPAQQQARRRDVQMIFQNPYASLNPAWTIEAILREPLELMGLNQSRSADRDKLCEMLRHVELDSHDTILRRHPSDFSGGQRQRLALARALLLEPKLLVCDEATSALDVSIQADIVKLLKRLQNERHLGLVIIAHDLAMIAALADEVIVMHHGEIVEQGDVQKVLNHPTHSVTQQLCAASDGGLVKELY